MKKIEDVKKMRLAELREMVHRAGSTSGGLLMVLADEHVRRFGEYRCIVGGQKVVVRR